MVKVKVRFQGQSQNLASLASFKKYSHFFLFHHIFHDFWNLQTILTAMTMHRCSVHEEVKSSGAAAQISIQAFL